MGAYRGSRSGLPVLGNHAKSPELHRFIDRWPFALLLVLFGIASIFMGRISGLVRRFNMESLLKNNAESFPCLRPVVGRGKYLLSPESYDSARGGSPGRPSSSRWNTACWSMTPGSRSHRSRL